MKTWVRVGMVLLAVPQLVIGIWAMLAPHSWYQSFPGVEPHLISADPPYNAHLATDAGIGFFCTGVGLLVAAAWGRRSGVWVALVTFLAFAVAPCPLPRGPQGTRPQRRLTTCARCSSCSPGSCSASCWRGEHGAERRTSIPSSDPESFVHSARDPAGP